LARRGKQGFIPRMHVEVASKRNEVLGSIEWRVKQPNKNAYVGETEWNDNVLTVRVRSHDPPAIQPLERLMCKRQDCQRPLISMLEG
jgi:hypothetical protein